MAKSFRDVLDPTATTAVSADRPPRMLLDELASTLTSRALYKIRFDVETITSGDHVTHTMSALVPRLDNYILQLLNVSHPALKLYPVSVFGLLADKRFTVANEDELFDALATAVTSDHFSTMFKTLLAQA